MELEPFADWLRTQDRAELTIEGYLRDVRLFAKHFEERTRESFSPELVTPLDIRSYRDHLRSRGLAPSTCARKLGALSTFFRWAHETGRIASNPAGDIRRPGQVEVAPKWLGKSERHALERELLREEQLAELRGNPTWARRNTAVVLLLLNAGLRCGELVSLTLSDVEVSSRSGRIRVRGKGDKERVVPLNGVARRALSRWLEVRPAGETEALFTGQRGDPLSARGVQRIVKKVSLRAGLEGVTPHTLRHTFGKGLVDAGVSLDRVAKLLGHASINTTKIYTAPSQADLEEAVERLAL